MHLHFLYSSTEENKEYIMKEDVFNSLEDIFFDFNIKYNNLFDLYNDFRLYKNHVDFLLELCVKRNKIHNSFYDFLLGYKSGIIMVTGD